MNTISDASALREGEGNYNVTVWAVLDEVKQNLDLSILFSMYGLLFEWSVLFT